MSLQEDIFEYLKNKGLVDGFGEDCFEDIIPEEPDNIVTLYEYSGEPIIPLFGSVHRSLQCIVRNTSQSRAKALATRIYKALLTENMTLHITEERFAQIYIRQVPFKLDTDKNNRTLYCFNIGLTTSED